MKATLNIGAKSAGVYWTAVRTITTILNTPKYSAPNVNIGNQLVALLEKTEFEPYENHIKHHNR